MTKAAPAIGFPLKGADGRTGSRPFRWGIAAALVLTGVWLYLVGGLTVDGTHRGSIAVVRVAMHASGPLAWMLSSFGLGIAISKRLGLGAAPHSFALVIGCCAMLLVDAVAGVVGVLGLAGGLLPAALLLLPGYFGLWRNYQLPWPRRSGAAAPTNSSAPWFAWTIAAPMAVLVLACASAPGWLWSTEFGGYDVLSYHLELPREWLARGRIMSLDHNAYSLLPSYMEAAYLHLMALRGDAHSAALSAQVLHALMAVAAAVMTGVVARTIVERGTGGALEAPEPSAVRWIAGAVLLGTPWVIVTATLAYNEMPMLLALAAALWLVFSRVERASVGEWLALGLLLDGAVGAKLTALPLVAVPMVIALAARGGFTVSGLVRGALIVGSVLFVLLAPWWLRTLIEVGSPFFPIVGSGGLSAERATAFHAAHASPPPGTWWLHARDQYFAAGFGESPTENEPWRAFWSILPGLGVVAALWLIVRGTLRRPSLTLIGVVMIQLGLWIMFTHAKGRFLLPTAVPLAVLVALAFAPMANLGWLGKSALAALAGAWCLQPLMAYATDGPIIDGCPSPATGVAMESVLTGEVEGTGLPALLKRLPEGSRVATLGAAAVFWWPMIPGYSTVWNDGPVTRAMRESGGDASKAAAALRSEGWTHIVIDRTMLRVWEQSGWLDPIVTRESVDALARELLPARSFGSTELFTLPSKVRPNVP